MNYSIRPEEHELREVRQILQGVIEISRAFLPKEEDIKLNLGWTEDDFVMKEMGGSTGLTYSYRLAEIEFNSTAEDWKTSIKLTAAHEYSHMWFYEKLGNKKYEDVCFIWQHLLMEAQAQLFAEKVTDEQTRMKDSVPIEHLERLWPELKEKLGENSEFHGEFFTGKGDFPMWAGYALAYQIGQKLLENHELDELPELKKSDVIDAGDRLFD